MIRYSFVLLHPVQFILEAGFTVTGLFYIGITEAIGEGGPELAAIPTVSQAHGPVGGVIRTTKTLCIEYIVYVETDCAFLFQDLFGYTAV